jgi:hypothetical protein
MNARNDDGHYDVYWPRAARRGAPHALAPRLNSLDGKLVLQLWDFIFHGDKVFELLEEKLRERYPTVRFVSWRETGNILGMNEREVLDSLPRRVRELGVHAVITGMAC